MTQLPNQPSTVRARDLGIPFSGTPGRLNAITDVPGVEVGYCTLWKGEGALRVGEGPVRTGVTAILPRGKLIKRACFGGAFALNGAGEVTGLTWLEERGLYDGPLLITNTHSVGVVRDAAIQWMRREGWSFLWTTPIVGETYDGMFNDMDGHHLKCEHAFAALDGAHSGAIREGNVGGGAGMMTYEFKGGTGTASRELAKENGSYTVGVLVQSNYGKRHHLRIAGVPMGEVLGASLPSYIDPSLVSADMHWQNPGCSRSTDGSIIVVILTNAPLLPHQLRRLAKRPALAIGRLGGVGAAGSGDIFIALSTANEFVEQTGAGIPRPVNVKMHPNASLTALFEAAIDATEESIVNALVASETAEGANRLLVPSLPHDRVQEELRRHALLRKRCK